MPKIGNMVYSSFGAIGLGGAVYLRVVRETENDKPTFRVAQLVSQPSGEPGAQSATFFVPGIGRTITGISENQYDAWTRS